MVSSLARPQLALQPQGQEHKLTELTERFQGLERQVQADVKARRDLEVSTFEAIAGNCDHLSQCIEVEGRRRREAYDAVQAAFQAKLAEVERSLENRFLERYDHIHSTLDTLNDRVDGVEQDFALSQEAYVHEMQVKSNSLAHELEAFKMIYDQEIMERRKREASLIQQIQRFEARTAEKLEHERQICEHKFARVWHFMQESRTTREQAQKSYEALVNKEVERCRRDVANEALAREQADDEIVNVLNYYTKVLQSATRSVSRKALEAADQELLPVSLASAARE